MSVSFTVCTIECYVNNILYWFVFKGVPANLFIAFCVKQSDLCETSFDTWIKQMKGNKFTCVICVC